MPENSTDGKEQDVSEQKNTDEINLLEYVYALLKGKWFILGLVVIGVVTGNLLARMKGPVWVAEVVIAPKENESPKTPNLSSLGAFGGLVASQLNIGGNASIGKIELLLGSRDFNARLLEKYRLLPSVYKMAWPKMYAEYWDSSAGTWKASFPSPNMLGVGDFIKKKFLKTTSNPNNTMTIEIHSKDSTFSDNLARMYISFLDEYIRSSVSNDAKENVDYLEKQLISISDPLLREKLQGSIADEIEKAMVVSKEAFKGIDSVYLTRNFKEKRLYPTLFGGGFFFFAIIIIVFMHAFSSGSKTEEDMRLITLIKNEIFFFKMFRK